MKALLSAVLSVFVVVLAMVLAQGVFKRMGRFVNRDKRTDSQ